MIDKVSGSHTRQVLPRTRDAQIMAGLGIVLLAFQAMAWMFRPVTWLVAIISRSAFRHAPVSAPRQKMPMHDDSAFRETMLKRIADDQR